MFFHRIPAIIAAAAATALTLSALLSAQAASTLPQGTVFRATTNYVSTNVFVRDQQGRFVQGLRPEEFRVFEDGVPQKVTNFSAVVGGRVVTSLGNATAAVPAAPTEGLILPQARPHTDVSGRIFIIFIDDLHFTTTDTPRVRQLMEDIRDTIIHDDDLVGFVSTGPSAIEVNPVYDFKHRRFTETIAKVLGSALPPDEVVKDAQYETKEGPTGLRFNAHTAFKTAYDMLDQLAAITDRRKSFIYISDGYSFDPFNESRYKQIARDYESLGSTNYDPGPQSPDDTDPDNPDASTEKPVKQSDLSPWDSLADPMYRQRTMFAETDLVMELAQLVRTARRSNVIFYTVDPRGLDANLMDAASSGRVTTRDMAVWMTQTQGTLKILGNETGGFCVCDVNDIKPELDRIDNETSNYYMIGYTTTNPDPTVIRRRIKIEVTRPGASQLTYSDSYTITRSGRSREATEPH
jgi:VWFA-related protein